MENIRKLLQAENSELGRLVKFNLYGLKAALKQALTELPNDPEEKLCQQILEEINNVLQPESTIEDTKEIPISSRDSNPTLTDVLDIGQSTTKDELQLLRLQKEFNSDQKLNSYLNLKNIPLKSENDPDLWNEIQRKLLRVPEELAEFWRQRALAIAREVGAQEDISNCIELPFNQNKNIFPGLKGSIETKGLCFSNKASLDPQIPQLNLQNHQDDFQKDINLVATIISTYIQLIEEEIEPELHHALKSVFAFDTVNLYCKPEQSSKYIEALVKKFEQMLKVEKNLDYLSAVLAWIDLDEAIHSLVFLPPADRFSWWGKLQQEVRRIVKKVADRASSRIRPLSGLYADVFRFSKDDLRIEFGGNPGEVLTCLRVYAKINEQEFPGRVLYHPLR